MAELKYWEFDGPYTLCDGTWRSVTGVNPAGVPIRVQQIELGMAVDNTLLADISLYVSRGPLTVASLTNGTMLSAAGFHIQTLVPGTNLNRNKTFSPDWMTVGSTEALTLTFVGYPNSTAPRNYIPVARLYYTVTT